MSKLLFATSLILFNLSTGCSGNTSDKPTENLAESVFVLHNVHDTSLLSYYDEIFESPEFINWRFNPRNPDTSKIVGFFSHSSRVLKIQDKIYYESDITRITSVPKFVSTIPIEHVCTFRIDTENRSIKIFNRSTEKFIDFRTKKGQGYFKSKLNE